MGTTRSQGSVLALLAGALAAAACVVPAPALAQRQLPRHLFLVEVPVNREEAFLGVAYRFLPSRSVGLGPFLSFQTRPDETKTVLQRIRPHFFVQREEKRFLGSLGVEHSHYLGAHAGVFAAAGAGYTFGSFQGTRAQPEEGWTPILRAGLLARFGSEETAGHVRAGYEYADLRSGVNNRAYLAAGVEFK
jgi:hypothetical protein